MVDARSPQHARANDSDVDANAMLRLTFAALDREDQGIGIFDSDRRLALFNQAFVELLGAPQDTVRTGMALDALVKISARADAGWSGDFHTLLSKCASADECFTTCNMESVRPDGRTIETRCYGLPGGGLVTTQSDITERKRTEIRLEDAVHSLAEGFMLWDADDRLVTLNDRIREFYEGLEDILVPGRLFLDNLREAVRRGVIIIPPAVDPEDWIRNRVEQHRNPSGPIERQTITGRWLRIVEHKTADDGIVGIVVDITDLKNAQEALKESNQRFQLVVAGTNDGLWDWDLAADKVWYSPRWAEIIGYESFEMDAYEWEDHVHPEDLPRVKQKVAEHFAGTSPKYSATYRHRHKDGGFLWIEAHGCSVRDEQGKAVRFTGRMTDVTSRKRGEEALRRSEASLANAQRIARLGNWDLKVTSNEFTWSDEIYRIFGLTPQSLPANYDEFLDIVHPEDREMVRKAVNAALYDNAEYEFEHRIIRPGGSERIVRQHGEVTFDDSGTALRMTGTVQDITERKMAEQALKETEERFRLAFETSPDSVTISRLSDGLYVDVNGGFTVLCGYAEDEVIGKSTAKIGFWADPNERKRLVARLRKEGQVKNVDIQVRHKDSRVIAGMLSASIIMLNDQPHMLAITRDISELKQAEEELRKLWRAVEQAPAAVMITNTEGVIEYVNPKFSEITGYARWEALGATPGLLKSGEMTRERYRKLWTTIKRGREWRGELRNRRKDGNLYWASASISPVKDAHGEVTHFVGIQSDVTDQKHADERLRASEERFRSLVESSVLGIVIDDEGKPLFANQTYADIFGYESPQEILALGLLDQLYTEIDLMRVKRYRTARLQGQSSPQEYEFQGVTKNGSLIWLRTQLNMIPWSGKSVIQSTVVDITLRKVYEERLHYQANFDSVTDLPNRTLALDRLSGAVARARRHARKVGILFVDLDHFKKINDTMGHALGDKLLRQAAHRIKSCVREDDTVARLGGDEFTVILPDIGTSKDAESVSRKILDVFGRPFSLDNSEAFVSASVGISLCPDDGNDAETLMRNADAAMYQAKEQGRNTVRFFTPKLNERALERIRLEAKLRGALDRKQFILHYQPLVDMRSDQIIGAEALLRWPDSKNRPVSTERVIRLAEDTGLIVPLGEWVLHTACKQIKLWRAEGLGDLRVSVNVSSRQFRERSLVDAVTLALRRNRLSPDCLELEITEGLLMDDLPETKNAIGKLESHGVRLAVDDFGTGYSSLRYLTRFPLDTLKIDRSFIKDVLTDQAYATLVEAIIAMAHRLNLRVIAEGVETEKQLEFLRARGCDVAQGFYFSNALSPKEFGKLIRSRRQPDVKAG